MRKRLPTYLDGDPVQLNLDGSVDEAQGGLFDPPPPLPPDVTRIGSCPTCGASTRFTAADERCDRCRDLGARAGELPVDERAAHRAVCPGALMRPVIGPQTPVCNVCDWSPGQPIPTTEEG